MNEDIEVLIRRALEKSKWREFRWKEILIKDLLLISHEFINNYNDYNIDNFYNDLYNFMEDDTMMEKLCNHIEKTENFIVPEIKTRW